MKLYLPNLRAIFATGLLGLVTGCNGDDGDKLVRIGKLSAEKIRDAVPAKVPLADLPVGNSTVAKVRMRLKSDIYFVNLPVQISEEGDAIHLKGVVPTKEHVELAEQLARQTVGVRNVVNELTVGP